MAEVQPLISGIQTVGQVKIMYQYQGSYAGENHALGPGAGFVEGIKTGDGIELAGFRLDDNFLAANPQLASSLVVPLLGGGAIALTNNNRSGQLTLSCVRAGQPVDASKADQAHLDPNGAGASIVDLTGKAVPVFDPIAVAQCQQAQSGGDAAGAKIAIGFAFNGKMIIVQFDGCTVAQSGILQLAGNTVPGYGVQWNYLNWGIAYNQETLAIGHLTSNGCFQIKTTP